MSVYDSFKSGTGIFAPAPAAPVAPPPEEGWFKKVARAVLPQKIEDKWVGPKPVSPAPVPSAAPQAPTTSVYAQFKAGTGVFGGQTGQGGLETAQLPTTPSGTGTGVYGQFQSKTGVFAPKVEPRTPEVPASRAATFKAELGEKLFEKFPGTMNDLVKLQSDPLNLKDVNRRLYDSTVGAQTEIITQAGNDLRSLLEAIDRKEKAINIGSKAWKTATSLAGALLSPISTLFTGAAELPIVGAPIRAGVNVPFAATGEALSNLSDEALTRSGLPADVQEKIRAPLRDTYALLGQLVLGEAMHQAGFPKEALRSVVKETQVTYNLPRDVYIDASKIKDIFQTGEKISPEEFKLVQSLGLDANAYKNAAKNGLSVRVPIERITTITDRPYYAKIKELARLKPSEPQVTVERPEKPGQAPAGALPAPQGPAVGDTIARNIELYKRDGGFAAGTEAPSAAIRDLAAAIERPDGRAYANEAVSRAISEGKMKVGEDGTVKLYRAGEPSAANPLASATYDRATAARFVEEAKLRGQDLPLIEFSARPEDVKVFVGGGESEVLVTPAMVRQQKVNTEIGVDKSGLNYEKLLMDKIILQKRIAELEPTVKEVDRLENTSVARELRRLKTELNFTEDAMGKMQASGIGYQIKDVTPAGYGPATPPAFDTEAAKARIAASKAAEAPVSSLENAVNEKPFTVTGYAGISEGAADSGFRTTDRSKAEIYARDRGGEVKQFTETMQKPLVTGDQTIMLGALAFDGVPGAKELLAKYEDHVAKTGGTTNTDPIVKEVDDFIRKELVADGYDGVVYRNVNEYQVFPKEVAAPALPETTLKVPAVKPSEAMLAKVAELTQQIRDAYLAKPEAEQALQGIIADLLQSQPRTLARGPAGEAQNIPSTFPKWVPERLRSRDLFEKVVGRFTAVDAVANLSYPEGKRPKQRELMDAILGELDRVLKVSTADARNGILSMYESPEAAQTAEAVRELLGGRGAARPGGGEINAADVFGNEAAGKPAATPARVAPSGAASEVYPGRPKFEKELGSLGAIDAVRPIEFPELVQLAKDLSGKVPAVRKFLGKAAGRFYGGTKEIKLLAQLFEDGNTREAALVLAHEIGHLIDYLPEGTLSRGNLLGRLNSLHGFLKTAFGAEGPIDLAALRKEATTQILEENGYKFGDLVTGNVPKSVRDLIKARVDEMVLDEGGIRDATVRKELLDVTRWWKPYDPKAVTKSYLTYRESAKELYADAISVLFNTPGTLERMAPTFYNEFFAKLDLKPEVRRAFFDLQELLTMGHEEIVARRRAGITEMFKEGDLKSKDLYAKKRAERDERNKNMWFRFKLDVVSRNQALIDRVSALEKAGTFVHPDENPVLYLRESNYLGGKIKGVFETSIQPIYRTLSDSGVAWEQFGEALMYERIISGDRSTLANPRGISPTEATEQLSILKRDLGKGAAEILDEQVVKLREAMRALADEAYQEGLYTEELYQKMTENPAYVPFQVLEHLETDLTWKVKGQVGTLKDIANPANSALLKMISTLRAIERNKVTRVTADFLEKNFPSDIQPAEKIFTGKGQIPIESREANQELIQFYRKGKLVGYYVDPYIAAAFERGGVGANNVVIQTLKFFNAGFFRPLFITYNLGFQSFNLLRDFQRYWKNIPGATLIGSIKRYGQAFPVAKFRAFGIPKNPTIADRAGVELLQKMEREQVLSVTYNDLVLGRELEDAQVDEILVRTGVAEGKLGSSNKIIGFAKLVLQTVKEVGDLIETLPKAAGYLELEGKMAPREMRDFVRRNLGSPDFLEKGRLTPATNEIFLFSNAIIQGITTDIGVATNPKTRSGYWWKTAAVNVAPKILMFAALLGLFGSKVKKGMEDASEYDRTNYTVIPIGTDSANGKTIYLRIPQDETGRTFGGVLWKALQVARGEKDVVRGIMDIASYTGGQLPSVAPVIEATLATGQFLSGLNPYDAFRGRYVLTDDQYRAGGWEATKAYGTWLFQQMGGGVITKFYAGERVPTEKSTGQKILELPVLSNILGRFVRISDYGQLEQYRAIIDKAQSQESQDRLEENRAVFDAVQQYQESEQTLADRIAAEKALLAAVVGTLSSNDDLETQDRLRKKFRTALKRGIDDPKVNALLDATTNDQKALVLHAIRLATNPEDFNGFVHDALRDGLMSYEVFVKERGIK